MYTNIKASLFSVMRKERLLKERKEREERLLQPVTCYSKNNKSYIITAFRITMVETKTTLKTVSHNSSLKILAKNVKEHYLKSVRVWSFSGLNA